MCMWLFVVTSLQNEVVHVLNKPRGRRHLLIPSSKSSREFKHKPICEGLFCLNVIHFSLGIPSQMSGVLLASKLAYVSISLADLPEHRSGCGIFASFLPLEEAGVCVSFQYLTHSHGAGWGEQGTIAIFNSKTLWKTSMNKHISTTISTMTCYWPLDTFKKKTAALFS